MTDRDDAVPTAADPSRNAVTHGLTARRPLCEQEAENLRLIADQWVSQHMPETEIEEAIIRTAASEYVRYLRCVSADEAQLRPNAQAALAEWGEKRRHAVRRKAQDLKLDPARVAAELHESAFGIDWMVRHWKALLGHIDTGRGWTSNDLEQALNLLGLPYQKVPTGGLDALLIPLAAAACPLTVNYQARPGIADAEAAAALRKFIADRIERLAALRPLVWEDVEGPQAAAVEAAAMLDTSKAGQLRSRYRREAYRDMQRGIGLFIRLRVERSKVEARQMRMERLAPRAPEPTAAEYSREQARRRAAAEVAANAPAAESRNEPPPPPSSEPDDRRKSNPNQPLTPTSSPARPAAAGRTDAPAEAHRAQPDAPTTAPDRPSLAAREAGSMPDRPR